MTKFKVGDKVAFKGNTSYKGVVQKVQPLFGHETIYTIKWNDGKQYDVIEGDLVLANSRIFNSVRGNTKLKNIDYWFADNGYGEDTLIKYVQSYKKNKCIDFVDRHADTAARDAFYDAMYELTGVKSRWALNSRACNSTNAVVAKAMNSKVAMNGDVDFSRKVKVRAVSATVFGPKDETKVITLGQLRDNFAQSGHSRLFPMVLKDIEAGRIANPNYETPCDVWVQWA